MDSCSHKSRDDLQKLKNKALRYVHSFRLINAPSIEVLHNMSNILSLQQRREKQLLNLMLWYSKNDDHILKKERRTQLQCKINFKVLPLKSMMYINSPMNRGNILWNKLTQDEQTTFSNLTLNLVHPLLFSLAVCHSPRLPGPWPTAVGFPALPGRKSSQFLHGRDFLFY